MRKQVEDITMATTAPARAPLHVNRCKEGWGEMNRALFKRARFFRWRSRETVIDKTASLALTEVFYSESKKMGYLFIPNMHWIILLC